MFDTRSAASWIDAIGDVPVLFGLRQQGLLEHVARAVKAGVPWEQIGREIGWEANQKYVDCCWTWVDQPNCVRRPTFRLATPHGHMDFCPEHIGYMIAALPPEWLEGWAYREPATIEGSGDDIPF